MDNPHRIIFFGTPEFAVPALTALMKHRYTPISIVTAPDAPKGRGLRVSPSPMAAYAQDIGFAGEILKPEKIDNAAIAQIQKLEPTLGISVAYGIILPQALLDIFPQGILNIHPSLLPRHRGPSPLQAQILEGDPTCGVTIMKIDAKMDHGPILLQESFPVDPLTITLPELHGTSAQKGADLLIQAIQNIENGSPLERVQDEEKATFTRMLKKEDGRIDWTKGAVEIDRMVRALNPWPSTYTFLDSKRIKILRTKPMSVEKTDREPGHLYPTGNSLTVACGDGALSIERLQLEGDRPITAEEFLSTHANMLNMRFDTAPKA